MKKNNLLTVLSVIALIVMLLFGAMINRERDEQFEQYAKANNCEWIWQGTAYGDDRDYICK